MPKASRDLSKKRQKRPRFGGHRNVMTFGEQDPNYFYYVYNDDDEAKMQFAETMGYEFVKSDEGLGDPGVGVASKFGSAVTKPVGGGVTGVLMRLRLDWYKENKAEEQKEIDEKERGLRRQIDKEGHYGDITIK